LGAWGLGDVPGSIGEREGGGVIDDMSRRELGARWAYRAGLEHDAAARFERLAQRLEGFGSELVAIATAAVEQEREHVRLCAGIAERFGHGVELGEPQLTEVAPQRFDTRDRVVYEVVAFCCITETANAAVVTAGADDVDDAAIRKAVRTILADEVQHSRLGWRFLTTHPPDDTQRAWLARYVPDMLRGTVREDLFAPAPVIGDEATMAKYGTLPIEGRRTAFLEAMREVVLPGLAQFGVDVAAAEAFLAGLGS
jgi:hypothetical protein